MLKLNIKKIYFYKMVYVINLLITNLVFKILIYNVADGEIKYILLINWVAINLTHAV
jgi:hypothetical protein